MEKPMMPSLQVIHPSITKAEKDDTEEGQKGNSDGVTGRSKYGGEWLSCCR